MCAVCLILIIGLPSAFHALLGFPWGFLGFSIAVALSAGTLAVQKLWWQKFTRHPLHWLRAKWGWGKSIAELARRLDMVQAELEAFQPAYKEVFIAKRNGDRRRLLVPNDVTKVIQRRILRRLLGKLRVHPAAQGFVKDRSAIKNAAAHVGQAVVITLDIVDFFPSTGHERIEAYFRRIGWNAQTSKLLTRLTTWEGGLPQGAPTSPALSNLVNFYMDAQIARKVAQKKGTYTRYADDIAISYPLDYPATIHSIVDKVKRIARSKGYRIHTSRKLRIRRQHQRQVVTGLVVNAKPQLPRKLRRWLRAVAHHRANGKPITLSEAQWLGWKSYLHAIAKQAGEVELKAYRLKDNRRIVARRKKMQKRRKKEATK